MKSVGIVETDEVARDAVDIVDDLQPEPDESLGKDDATAFDGSPVEDTQDTAPLDTAPVDCGDCDDGLECTNDVCLETGVCEHVVKVGFCRVAGACVEAGDGPAPCRICVPTINAEGLTSLTGGPCDDGNPCTLDDTCSLGNCVAGETKTCEPRSLCEESLGCDRTAGCVYEPFDDGTPCGANQACLEGVCIEGDGMATGTIAWFDAVRCPVGWEQYGPATGRTLAPVSESDIGRTEDIPTARESHVASLSFNIGTVSYAGIVGGGNGLAHPGTPLVTVSIEDAPHGLPTLALLACIKTEPTALGNPPSGVFIFTEGLCAEGEEASLEGVDRLLIGAHDAAGANAVFGGSPGLSSPRSHTHTLSGTFEPRRKGIALISGCCGGGYASASPLAFSTTTTAVDTQFPWRGVRQCLRRPTSELADTAPSGIVLASSEPECPPGFVPEERAAGRIIIGAETGGNVGTTSGEALTDREDRSHDHAVSIRFSLDRRNIAGANGNNNQGADHGEHTLSTRTGKSTTGLPFRQLRFCRKP